MITSIYNTEDYREEGRRAAQRSANSWDNPYDYRFETPAANAWDDGYNKAKAAQK
jgi:hypothetical protein